MAWITMIDEEDADSELRSVYSDNIEPWGGVDNIMKIHSLNPPSLEGHALFYKILMRGKSALTIVQREMIAIVVSAINQCLY